MKKFLFTLTAFCIIALTASAESMKVSLLTCYPGQEVFELYGHTAIRITADNGMDRVYNFGLFSFNQPHFIYRFVKGETDYRVGGYPTEYFSPEYAERGSKVVEQRLNLTDEQATWLFYELERLCLPENCEYRYNYVRNNCATRPRDLIEQAVGGLRYPTPEATNASYRDLMRSYSKNYPWYQFGIDLALGSGIDQPLTTREQMFAPIILMREMAGATQADGKTKIVASTSNLVEGSESSTLPPTPFLLSPLFVCWLALALIVAVSLHDIKRGATTRWVDTLWFTLTGLLGCLLFFLIFVSQHEATSPNWLGFWLNPFCLFAAVAVWIKSAKKWLYSYHFLNFALVLILMAGWWAIPQSANAAFFPLMLCSIARSASYIIIYRRCVKRSE